MTPDGVLNADRFREDLAAFVSEWQTGLSLSDHEVAVEALAIVAKHAKQLGQEDRADLVRMIEIALDVEG